MSADNLARCPMNCQTEIANPLREFWEIGIIGRTFIVDYRAVCRECGFEFSYKHEESAC